MAAPLRAQTELFAESRSRLSSQSPRAGLSANPNPVLLNIKPSFLEALQALGYSESEARFLYVVGHAFRLLCGASIPRFHLWPLGQNARPRSGANFT